MQEFPFLDPAGVNAITQASGTTETVTFSGEDFITVVRALEYAYRNGALHERYDLSIAAGELVARIGNTKGILFTD